MDAWFVQTSHYKEYICTPKAFILKMTIVYRIKSKVIDFRRRLVVVKASYLTQKKMGLIKWRRRARERGHIGIFEKGCHIHLQSQNFG